MATQFLESEDRRLETFLQTVGARANPHGHGRSLYDHLKGTRDVLRCWSQPFWIQTAGLFHSIYSTDVYRRQVLDVNQRERLQDVIGKKAEQLVYLFHKLPRQRFFDRLFKFTSLADDGLVVPVETDDKLVDYVLGPSEVFGLIVIHMANEAEQTCLSDGKPGVWLTHVSERGAQLQKAKGLVPPVFDKCSVVFSSNDERQLNDFYTNGFDNLPEAEAHFARCSEICPWIAEPLILRAYLKSLDGDTIGAAELSVQAINILNQWGTAWDKRLFWLEWKQLAEVLLNQNEPVNDLTLEVLKEPRRLFDRVVTSPKPAVSQPTANGSAPTRLERYIAFFADASSDPLKRIYPDLPSQPWHNPQNFPIVSALESAYQQIKEEVMRLPEDDFHKESETIGRVGSWDVFFFYERGNKNIGNCARCPTITKIIEDYDTLKTQAGLIYLSRLRSGTHIAAHRGPTNLRLRCHLGIQVPEGDCRLRVGDEVGSWKQGRCIVFDDYFEHEAWNRTGEDRIVLIVDLWHSSFTTHERNVLKGLHDYAFAHARGLHRYWIENMKSKFTVGASHANARTAIHDYH